MGADATFVLSNAVWKYENSKNVGDDNRYPVSITRVDVPCNACQHAWHASESATRSQPGQFYAPCGLLSVTCPMCGVVATVSHPSPPARQ